MQLYVTDLTVFKTVLIKSNTNVRFLGNINLNGDRDETTESKRLKFKLTGGEN